MVGYMSITARWAIFQSISSTVPIKASIRNMPHLTAIGFSLNCVNTEKDSWSQILI